MFNATTKEMQMEYGKLQQELDGRLTGHVLTVIGQRRDGKFTCVHVFGGGARITKIYTAEQLAAEAAKLA
jgi:hypothetical protein